MGGTLEESSKVRKLRKDHSDWQEEKKRWISAAGVSTPMELAIKMEGLSKAAAKSSVDLQKLARHLTEVKTFLVELRELERGAMKRRKSRDQLSRAARKRNRSGCRIITLLESSGSIDESSRSPKSQERSKETKGESLLDPNIMKSFATLIKASKLNNQQSTHVVAASK